MIYCLFLQHIAFNALNLHSNGTFVYTILKVQGLWKTRTFKMAFLCFHVQELLKLFKSVKFVHIRRMKNLHAARLAHEAINIHWDRLASIKSQCEEIKQKKKNNENKKNDNDKSNIDDVYYEYKYKLKKR